MHSACVSQLLTYLLNMYHVRIQYMLPDFGKWRPNLDSNLIFLCFSVYSWCSIIMHFSSTSETAQHFHLIVGHEDEGCEIWQDIIGHSYTCILILKKDDQKMSKGRQRIDTDESLDHQHELTR